MDCYSQGCQPPTSSNIENNIDREGMIDVIITPNYSDCHKFAMTENARKPIRLLYYKGMPELMKKSSMLTLKELQQCKVVEILLSKSRVYWRNANLQHLSGRFLFSNLETGRYNLKSGVSRVLWESWQSALRWTSMWISQFRAQLERSWILSCPLD